MGDSGVARATILAALIGAVAIVVAALIQSGVFRDGPAQTSQPTVPSFPIGEAAVFPNKLAAPAGETVLVSGNGFAAGETVEIWIGAHFVATTTADAGGAFANVAIVVPDIGTTPFQADIIATGRSSVRSAITPFTVSG